MRTALDQLLPELSETVCTPLASKLKEMGVDDFIFIPAGRLALLPLHAAIYQDNGIERTLLDGFTISYAPSARALLYSKQTVDSLEFEQPSLLSIGNPLPLPKGVHPLRFAHTEVEEIVSLFGSRAQSLYEKDALKDEVEKQLEDADYLHFACHGEFDPQEPLQSGLLMSHGEKLTLQDILERTAPSQARLAILSACQTAITDFQELPEEAIGLPSGFMQAGIPGVIGTLWPVNDLSTALLMIRFYQYHLEGDPERGSSPLAPAEALRRSQQWLRSVKSEEIKTYVKAYLPEFQRMNASQADVAYKRLALEDDETCPFAHPYYWAGFTFTGI
jgi:CHAT domain-containing protein